MHGQQIIHQISLAIIYHLVVKNVYMYIELFIYSKKKWPRQSSSLKNTVLVEILARAKFSVLS